MVDATSRATAEPPLPAEPVEPARLTLSLSGGGYRATVFGAGALLAVADSSLRDRVSSVSSVSGGSIASAVTIGGFADPSPADPDPMGRRVRLLCGLVQTKKIATQDLLGWVAVPAIVLVAIPLMLFLLPEARTPEDSWWTRVFIVLGGIAGYAIVAAFVHSWFTVQSAVETLVAASRRTTSAEDGATLAEIAADEDTTRIFCATDLSSGAHVYLSPDHVQLHEQLGRGPAVFLADVVAASACFPGFRPVVFRRGELGFGDRPSGRRPRLQRMASRLGIGLLGLTGVVIALAAVVIRILGPLDAGWTGLGIALALIAGGLGLAWISAHALWLRDDLVLVDGGVCDNLGAAFALLAEDDRYSDLPAIAGTDEPGLMLVIDASKPFNAEEGRSSGLGELLPLRVRGAQRSLVKLLGNANASARRHVIELVLRSGGRITGDVVSILDHPAATMSPGSATGAEPDFDWQAIVRTTSATPTTLDALRYPAVFSLLLQSYRLTQATLVKHGARLERVRTAKEILEDLVLDAASTPAAVEAMLSSPVPAQAPGNMFERLVVRPPSDIKRILAAGRGPYARRIRRTNIMLGLGVIPVLGILFWIASMF